MILIGMAMALSRRAIARAAEAPEFGAQTSGILPDP
jgi:hypothetical protein